MTPLQAPSSSWRPSLCAAEIPRAWEGTPWLAGVGSVRAPKSLPKAALLLKRPQEGVLH